MALENEEEKQQDSIADDIQNQAQNAKSTYDKAKNLYNNISNAKPSNNNTGVSNGTPVNGAGDGAKKGAEEFAKKGAEELGKKGAETAMATASVGAGVATGGVSTVVSTAFKTMEGTAQAINGNDLKSEGYDKHGEEEKKKSKPMGIIIATSIIIPLLLLLPVFLILLTPTMLLVCIIAVIIQLLSNLTDNGFWIDTAYNWGWVSQETRDEYYMAEIMEEYELDEDTNGVTIETAMIRDLSGTLIAGAKTKAKDKIRTQCQTENYNWYLTLDTFDDEYDNMYSQVNYAEIACVASQSPRFADAVSYTDYETFVNNGIHQEQLVYYDAEPMVVTYTLKELHELLLLGYDGIILSGGETCTIEFVKDTNEANRGTCTVSGCNAMGYQYHTNHTVAHEQNESTIAGYYCNSHAPSSVQHICNQTPATKYDFESDRDKYTNTSVDYVKQHMLNVTGTWQPWQVDENIVKGNPNYKILPDGTYVSVQGAENILLDWGLYYGNNPAPPPPEPTPTPNPNDTNEEANEEIEDEEPEPVIMVNVINGADLNNAYNQYRESLGNKLYTMQHLNITLHPYSLTGLYNAFNISPFDQNKTHQNMLNYRALDAKEEWLREYAYEISHKLGPQTRSTLRSMAWYSGNLEFMDIFSDDIIVSESEVIINLPNYYNQADPQWASLKYWREADGSYNTIKSSGCCLCAITMIADYFTPSFQITPATIQAYGDPIMTSDYKIVRTAVCSEFGFRTFINGERFDVMKCMEELQAGRPVIVYYPPTSNFTNNGHYAVINGYKYNEEGVMIFLTYDSGSRARTESGVTFDDMVYNAQTMWSYGVD